MVSPRWGCRASHGDVKSVRFWGRVGRGYWEREREGERGDGGAGKGRRRSRSFRLRCACTSSFVGVARYHSRPVYYAPCVYVTFLARVGNGYRTPPAGAVLPSALDRVDVHVVQSYGTADRPLGRVAG